ncbi:glycoside hydrolase family 3 C-terminal domain-containing protein [Goodfellowiella coeruleoviolacea]|uniref:Exo-alpha-(1->6)-L-arabinopyranosidase n=1 Tax=Goodfellowiella coeruleoviolacea TaxID=334858 RepID=A0AAE3GGK8_9PSEU|nr:glycoside hydrolase family 3 C-terminal domain-containing protein [Goodfellowiella coeruleoviolacea]MCP2167866.1 beta-glucosidase [Goodfellowiella coeruleoviolacea]
MTTDPTSLSLEQKASLLSGRDFWTTKPIEDAGVPSIVLTDGPHGIRRQDAGQDHLGIHGSLPATCFPPAVAVGSSWDPDVAARLGAAVGREARAFGVAVVLGPGVNIKRSPLCGRNFEYYSEDPLLSGVLGAAHVNALQAEGPGASVKHFAANNQETERMRVSAEVDERTLREIYLPAFERVVRDADPATVMCSYNKVNGVYASHNRWLLTDVLRGDWGFRGAVVSDWGAVSDRVAGVIAGMDLEMPGSGGTTDAQVVDAVRAGRLDEALVDRSARRVLALTELPHEATGDLDVEGHHALARELAAESVVLLKNDRDALPVRPGTHLAVIGAFATAPRFQGGGSSHINPTRTDLALEEIRALAGEHDVTVSHAEGFTLDDEGDAVALRAQAVQVAREADVAVVFAGLGDRQESEGFDRDTLLLPDEQVAVIREVAAVAPRTVVVLSHGGVVSLEGWHDDVDAVVEGFLLGQAGGGALADVLFGVVNPSGHLAETIPLRLEDNPSWLNFPGEQGRVRYGEGVLVGYRYYATAGVPVRYPFGHGLSYTSFATTGLEVEATGDDTAVARVTVTNTGDRAGKHVVQLYVSTDTGPVRRPVRELRAFAKVALEPGETRTVELALDRRAFAYWDVELGDWVVPAGRYAVQIGHNAHEVSAQATITLTGDPVVRALTLDSTVGDWFSHPVVGPVLTERMRTGMTEEQARQAAENPDGLRMVESMPMRQFLAFTNGAVAPNTLEQLMRLSTAPIPAK